MNFLICSFQLTVEMFDYLECELNLFLGGEFFCSIGAETSMLNTQTHIQYTHTQILSNRQEVQSA